MNPIVKGYLNSYKEEFGDFGGCEQSTLFEHFINWLITSQFVDDVDIDTIHTGGGEDLGIDGFAILINSFLVKDYDHAKYLLDELFKDKNLSVDFVFIQSKTSKKFDTGDIHKFFDGIKYFLSDNANLKNKSIENKKAIFNLVYKNSNRFSKNPNCYIFYVSLGRLDSDNDLERIKLRAESELSDESLFDEINIRYVDNNEVMKLYRNSQLKIEKTFSVLKNVSFPTVKNIKEAYISIMPINEYISIITENDQLISDLFYDNVRDYQGQNPVNREIESTIKSEKQKYFGFLNNGITIVTKEIQKTGDTLNVSNFQIVNGCQTSTILYNNREHINEESYITVKIIGTDNNEVINSIIRATNRQTEVKNEAFESLKEFHKRLEDFYLQFQAKPSDKIYYERRNKQYAQQNIPKQRIITLSAQVNAYIAMYLNQPHSIHRYYGELLKSNKIFNDKDELFPYYISALCLYKVDLEIKLLRGENYRLIKPFKYHIILCIKYLILGNYRIDPTSKKNEKDCEKIYNIINNEIKFKDLFNISIKHIKTILRRDFKHKRRYNVTRIKEFTDILLNEVLDNK